MDQSSNSSAASPPPAKPDLSIVPILHRADIGFVSFSSKTTKEWPMFACPIGETDAIPPAVMELMGEDAYLMINTAGTAGRRQSRLVPGYPVGDRGTAAVSHLNAVYCDLDTHTKNIDPAEALSQIIRLQDSGALPNASLFLRSGRGLWVFWLLVDHETGKPPLCTIDARTMHGKVQQSLAIRLAHLGADQGQATNVALHTRILTSWSIKVRLA